MWSSCISLPTHVTTYCCHSPERGGCRCRATQCDTHFYPNDQADDDLYTHHHTLSDHHTEPHDSADTDEYTDD
ncbi:MAG: hypothetical protein OHK0046_04100 [Anaerolineae bacterium]